MTGTTATISISRNRTSRAKLRAAVRAYKDQEATLNASSLREKGILIARTDETNPVAIRATRNQSQIIQRVATGVSAYMMSNHKQN